MGDQRCPTCGSEDIVDTGPLTVKGSRAVVSVMSGQQCTLCGNLQISIPQEVLVRLYPPGVRYLTNPRRARLHRRRAQSRREVKPTPPQHG